LTNDWDSFFVTALSDWDSAPSLSLSARTRKFDANPCGHRNSELRVCNGDYGATGWKGVNEAVFYTLESNSKNYIVSSVATMNDYYMREKSDAEKQYVMCHEIGHGFGLDHRDEVMDNADLGSCMDYTRNYSGNSRPDDVDFENLTNMYGRYKTRTRQLRERIRTSYEAKPRKIGDNYPSQDGYFYRTRRLVRTSNQQEIYEIDLGDGFKVLTVLHIA
jgi:hypothetical protein